MNLHTSTTYRGVPIKGNIEELENLWGSTRCANGFVYGTLVENKGKSYILLVVPKSSDISSAMIEVNPQTVGRCSGKRDIYEDMIYEGDIIKDVKEPKFMGFKGYVVRYDKELNKFYCVASNVSKDLADIKLSVKVNNYKGD